MLIYSIHKLTNVKRLTYNPNNTHANKISIYTLTEDPMVIGQGALPVRLPQDIKSYLLCTQNQQRHMILNRQILN